MRLYTIGLAPSSAIEVKKESKRKREKKGKRGSEKRGGKKGEKVQKGVIQKGVQKFKRGSKGGQVPFFSKVHFKRGSKGGHSKGVKRGSGTLFGSPWRSNGGFKFEFFDHLCGPCVRAKRLPSYNGFSYVFFFLFRLWRIYKRKIIFGFRYRPH